MSGTLDPTYFMRLALQEIGLGQYLQANTHMKFAINIKAQQLGALPPMLDEHEFEFLVNERGAPTFDYRIDLHDPWRRDVLTAAVQAIVEEIRYLDAQEQAIAEGALKPQGLGEWIAANIMEAHGERPWEDRPTAQSRLHQRTMEIVAGVNGRHGPDGATALILAAQECNLDRVRILLGAGADVNARTADGSTALILAAANGHLEVVRALLAANANVFARRRDGLMAVAMAAQGGHTTVVNVLRAAMA